ncbi:succinylglutamate desuccinylase/aspartoacylase family protein [Rhodohalobacter halophilus]|uniref:succinylglutamate desuccinylase/aspartoacylase family protein n=1 Tax=Rhodohalobacter halophilus TaxID=1812810 RepID=UPI00083FA069|nr:succinylglutamate desuccinylase/aspartoacylase family protein [Rhodohalobacter halophilus]
MSDIIEINGTKIARGEDKLINLSIAKLPTYTSIDLPVRVIRGEQKGPTLLISGGLHGDEINGIEIVRRMLTKNLLKPEAGSVIAIPLMNVYGFIQNVRGVPDGKDINRSFPGSKGGSLANLVAYNIMNEIIPKIDYGIDFHTGGASRSNFPQIRCSFEIDENVELAKAFSPPVILHSSLIDKSFRKAAYKKGKQILVFETGESLRIDEFGVNEAIQGTQRLMKHLGMISKAPAPQKFEIYQKSSWVRARIAGLFQPKIILGEHITKRQLLGRITDPYGNESVKVISKFEGRVIGLNYNPVVHKGDAILHIAKTDDSL